MRLVNDLHALVSNIPDCHQIKIRPQGYKKKKGIVLSCSEVLGVNGGNVKSLVTHYKSFILPYDDYKDSASQCLKEERPLSLETLV